MTRDESLFKIGIPLDLQILGDFWDSLNTQLHEIYNTVQVQVHLNKLECHGKVNLFQ